MIGVFIHIMDCKSNAIQEILDIFYPKFMNLLSRFYTIEIHYSLVT